MTDAERSPGVPCGSVLLLRLVVFARDEGPAVTSPGRRTWAARAGPRPTASAPSREGRGRGRGPRAVEARRAPHLFERREASESLEDRAKRASAARRVRAAEAHVDRDTPL